MIHQLIFAAPKPGMTTGQFQDYWVNTHGPDYASKIPQIKKYLIDTTIPFGDEQPPWQGIAEIWIPAELQLESLATPEFLNGARADEPNWAAFWLTVALDTDAHIVVPGDERAENAGGVKVVLLVKRKEGLPLDEFRSYSLGMHAELVTKVPGLRRYIQGTTVDGMYATGEAPLDAAYQLYFDDIEALQAALESPEFGVVEADLKDFVEPKYVHRLVVKEHWLVGPEPRP